MIYFISPHLDDAVLSAGGLIYELKKSEKLMIISVFTKGDRTFTDRKIEDINLCKFLGIEYFHLDFTDALWRDKLNIIEEKNLEKSITKGLKKIIGKSRDSKIFAPLSIGKHKDHVLINKIIKNNFNKVMFWEDFPYILKQNFSNELLDKRKESTLENSKNLIIKEKLILFYKSQIKLLFPSGNIPLIKEFYYSS